MTGVGYGMGVQHKKSAPGGAAMVEASILREVPSANSAGEARAHRLIATCNAATRRGFVQVAWSPVAQRGTLEAPVDGRGAMSHPLGGADTAALMLTDSETDTGAGCHRLRRR